MSSGFPVPFFQQVGIDDPSIFGNCHCGYLYTPVIRHLRPFAMWTAFPSADYYGHSVALGLAAGRRSRVRSNRTSERDVAWIMHVRSFCATGTLCYQGVSHQVKGPIGTLLIRVY